MYNQQSAGRRGMLLACPWVEPFSEREILACVPDFRAARAHAGWARLEAGRATWNGWAAAMTDMRAASRSTNLAAVVDALAVTDFTAGRFGKADLATLTFPGDALFAGAVFAEEVHFHGCRFHGIANFRGVRFSRRGAWFDWAQFGKIACFASSLWDGMAELRAAHFAGLTDFGAARFARDVWFSDTVFAGPVDFTQSEIVGEAGFMRCQFGSDTRFSDAAFGDSAVFVGSTFAGPATFERACFEAKARFSNARFAFPARFGLAVFHGGVEWPEQLTGQKSGKWRPGTAPRGAGLHPGFPAPS